MKPRSPASFLRRWFGRRKTDARTAAGLAASATDLTQCRQVEEDLRAAREEVERYCREARSAREAAEEANCLKNRFLAALSHELRTSLDAILDWTEILKGGRLDPEGMAQGLTAIERNARAQAQIIDDLLDVARVSSGRPRLEVQPLDSAEALEASVPPAGGAAAFSPSSEEPPLVGVRILAVDDDRDSLEMMAELLGLRGAEVASAASAAEALAALQRFEPDILVSDISMSGRDGYDLIRDIRSLGRSPAELPAVAVTALASAEDRRRALDAGYQVHLGKPVDPGELTAVIARLAHGEEGREL